MEKEIQVIKSNSEMHRWGLRHEDETGHMAVVGNREKTF